MSLINWDLLDKAYADTCEALKQPQKPAAKPAGPPLMTWKEFKAKYWHELPIDIQELLAVCDNPDAARRIVAVSDFAATVFSLWPDVRTEMQRLEADNRALVQERHQFRLATLAVPPAPTDGRQKG